MKTKSSFFALSVLLFIVFIFSATLLWEMAVYSRLDLLDRKVNQQWAQAEKAYSLQSSLIPNLIKIASQSNLFQKPELDEIINARDCVERTHLQARKAPKDAAKLAEFEKAQESLSWTLEWFFIVGEHNPALESNEHFKMLQAQFEKAQIKIIVESDHFNKAAKIYNAAFKFIPGASLLKILGQHKKPLLTTAQNTCIFPNTVPDFWNFSSIPIAD